MESQHSLEDLACLMPDEQQSVGPTTSASIDQQPIEHEVEAENSRDPAQEVKPVLEPIKPSNAPPTSTHDLSDSLFAFGNVEQLCADTKPKDDIWSMVRNRICARKNDLLPHSKCFLDTGARETKCIGTVSRNFVSWRNFCLAVTRNAMWCNRCL